MQSGTREKRFIFSRERKKNKPNQTNNIDYQKQSKSIQVNQIQANHTNKQTNNLIT